jgi:hypothetical protein
MTVSAEILERLIEAELALVQDTRVVSHIRTMLCEPHSIMRNWNYGVRGQQYLCWMVLKDAVTDAEVAYCEEGFGPKCPWGLVSSGEGASMGMDSAWYPTFMDAYFDSYACTTLPIWRVYKVEPDGAKGPLTAEGDWDATWREVKRLRESDPSRRYDCGHSVSVG